MLTIRPFEPADAGAVIELWRVCGLIHPTNDPKRDIARKLKVRGDLFLLGFQGATLVASAMVGYEGHRGWVNYFAVAPGLRRKGFGREMMGEAERRLRAEGCPKINVQVRTSNPDALRFYESMGFKRDEAVSLGKRLEHDAPPA